MFSLVLQRWEGLCSPRQFASYITGKRARHLELSKTTDLENSYDVAVNCMDFDFSDERYLLCGMANGVIVLYDIGGGTCDKNSADKSQPGELARRLKPLCAIGKSNKFAHKTSIETVQWYPFDSGLFASCSSDTFLKIWDANVLKPAETFRFPTAVYAHHMSTIASEHNLIAVAMDSPHVKLIDMRTGSMTHSLRGHEKAAHLVKWSPRLPFELATGSHDCKVLLWDIRMANASRMTLDQHNGDRAAKPESVSRAHNGHVLGMAFIDDGHYLLTYGADNRLRLWHTTTGENTLVNYGKIANATKQCVRLCVSSGTREPVVYIPNKDAIGVFDVFSGRRTQSFTGHLAPVTCCVYRSSVQEVYSSSTDRSILLWTPDFERENTQAMDVPSDRRASRGRNATAGFTSRIAAVRADNWSSASDDDQ